MQESKALEKVLAGQELCVPLRAFVDSEFMRSSTSVCRYVRNGSTYAGEQGLSKQDVGGERGKMLMEEYKQCQLAGITRDSIQGSS